MQALFVHGMGRSPASGWRLLRQLRHAGIATATFGYSVALSPFAAVETKLLHKVMQTAARGDYVLIGHSLGGVLLRAVLADPRFAGPPPRRLFLLGSPVRPARLAQRLAPYALYRSLTRDCGALLASEARMAAIAPSSIPTIAIVGVAGWNGRLSPFKGASNDGIVAESEIAAPWYREVIHVPVVHTLLPASGSVAALIVQRIAELAEES